MFEADAGGNPGHGPAKPGQVSSIEHAKHLRLRRQGPGSEPVPVAGANLTGLIGRQHEDSASADFPGSRRPVFHMTSSRFCVDFVEVQDYKVRDRSVTR
jgi:hypothetical protein